MSYAFPADYAAFWTAVAAYIAQTRASIGLPALNGPDGAASGSITLGQEFISAQLDGPAIFVVPDGIDFAPGKQSGNPEATIGAYTACLSWERCTAYLWGDPLSDSSAVQPYPAKIIGDSFNSTRELARELIIALIALGRGTPTIDIGGMHAKWWQPNNDTRRGRMLKLDFRYMVPVTDLPWISLPYATSTTSGVVVEAAIQAVSPDGSQTQVFETVSSPTSTEP